MESTLSLVWFYFGITISAFLVLLALRSMELKVIKDFFVKYLYIDSILLASYITLLVFGYEDLIWIVDTLCKCEVDGNTYAILKYVFLVFAYVGLAIYFFIKRSFMKQNHEKLVNMFSFIMEIIIFSIGFFLTWFLFRIVLFMINGE